MYNFITKTKRFIVAAALVALAGCAGSPITDATTRLVNLGQSLPENMRERHLAGWVGFDEAPVQSYNVSARSSLYGQGVEPGTPEFKLRVARVNISNSEPGMLWMEQGELNFPTGAVVPDHLRQLRAGDIVEIRQTGTWKTMKDFLNKGEGNIVVRILCSKGEPGFNECLDKAPRIGKFKGNGETHTPYPASVRDYGFTFTPMYDDKGAPLRPFPSGTPAAK